MNDCLSKLIYLKLDAEAILNRFFNFLRAIKIQFDEMLIEIEMGDLDLELGYDSGWIEVEPAYDRSEMEFLLEEEYDYVSDNDLP